ncbi:MAG TPA: aminotransferase class III-fold pyridoxal phosphate-dependent enzyme, partial [Acetobacteraceae bacterium]
MSGQDSPDGRIAIVGMAGRFPGAGSVGQFWDNLCHGIESVRFFGDDELDDWFDREVREAPNFVKARPVLDGVDQFDAGFFGMHAREAELTDPQHRIFLECAWQALEDAGCDPAAYKGAIGVFAGCSMNTYFLNNICRDRRALEEFTSTFQVGSYPVLMGAGREFLATRVSYKLDLRGPSLTIQTACSTSLVAVAQACQSLLLYQSDMALAGGVSISFPQHRGYLHQEGGMVSADGHCRPFDANASGTIFGSGAGVVLLKRLADAIADGDHVYAVILGCGLSNDGADKVGFTAPSVNGQAAAIEQALAQAGIEPQSVGYVECHGTATPLGDPIEIAALTKVFREATDDRQYCAIGSVKGNIGHLDAAAGVTGLIKTALMLKHRRLVPSLHFEQPNPHLKLPSSPFFVATGLDEWPEGGWPRRAGVSSLGVGGTNAHVILEEPPGVRREPETARPEVLVLSARSPAALSEMRGRLAEHLADQPEQKLADIAFTLQRGRRQFASRCALVCRDHADAAAILGKADSARIVHGDAAQETPPVAFMFPGQGAQYPGMARGLYERFPVFRRELGRCADILRPLGVSLMDGLYGTAESGQAERLARTGMAQPAIFSIEFALAQLWLSWGVQPCAFIGHSVGEFVAACLSGVFTLEDALGLVSARGRLMESLPAGGMTAVRLPENEVAPLLGAAVSLAAINGPSHCVVAGPIDAIGEMESRLEGAGVSYRRLHTSHAFHSAMMEPVIAPLADHVSRVPLGEPRVPWVSTVTGDWIGAEQAASFGYWARHAREPVRFAAGIRTLMAANAPILLEIGPGTTLSSLAVQTAHERAGKIISSLPDVSRRVSDDETILGAAGRLWVNGVTIDWDAIADAPRMRVPLPTYPFERRRYWVEPPARNRTEPTDGTATGAGVVAAKNVTDTSMKEQPMDVSPPSDTRPELRSAPSVDQIGRTIASILEDISGSSVGDAAPSTTFLEMGFDSLLLSQVAQQLQSRFKVKVAFRQLLGQLSTIPELADFLREHSPVAAAIAAPGAAPVADLGVAQRMEPVRADAAVAPAVGRAGTPGEGAGAVAGTVPRIADGATDGVAALMRAQVEAMSGLIQKQLDALQRIGSPGAIAAVPAPPMIALPVVAPPVVAAPPRPAALPEAEQRPSRFQAYRPVQKGGAEDIAPAQRQHIDRLVQRLTAKTAGSKKVTATYRPVLADPRAAAGFRAEWKELVYPVVCVRSHGSRLWDVDGNEYIDLVNGYGPTAFGHAADFVTAALREQLDKGFATGPQAEFAGEVAALFTEITGNERMTFCNTGSEAVMAALRVARAVTGRTKVVMFSGGYHGQFDEVLVRRGGRADGAPRSVPIASGIPASAVENIVVLDYATPAALEWVRENAGDLAAVIVEPVQSRHPDLRPFDFLRALREITEASGTAFIMDEIVTGFRVHPGGMQAVTGIRADLATYGKIIGGGMPIGILAGKAKFMDALDGGAWNYGDDSVPEVGVTFFAGTFVRHPLTLAAVRAVLRHLKAHGPELQEQVARRAEGLAVALDDLFRRHGMAAKVERYSSFLYFSLHADDPLAGLLFYHLRDRGIHVQDGFPLFLTTTLSEADISKIVAAFADSLNEMADAGIVKADAAAASVAAREVPLTESQVEIWLSAQMGDAASCAFNESVTLRLNGQLDQAALAGALAQVAARHDALRLRFSPTGEYMSAGELPGFDVPMVDAAGIADRSAEEVLASYIEADARTPFDLVEGPPVRARLFKLAPESHALVLTAHHIVCDGWSI